MIRKRQWRLRRQQEARRAHWVAGGWRDGLYSAWCRIAHRLQGLWWLPLKLVGWVCMDTFVRPVRKRFSPFGVSLWCGRQGEGKTISVVAYLRDLRRRYPKCIIVANFPCQFADRLMVSWKDLMEVRNGEHGVCFAIDEIQTEFSSTDFRDFPAEILTEITQQRKQRVKIVLTSQVFTRVVKAIREQCYEVVECRTLFRRLTINKAYDAVAYERWHDAGQVGKRPRLLWQYWCVQDDNLREAYDTDAKVLRLKDRQWEKRKDRAS